MDLHFDRFKTPLSVLSHVIKCECLENLKVLRKIVTMSLSIKTINHRYTYCTGLRCKNISKSRKQRETLCKFSMTIIGVLPWLPSGCLRACSDNPKYFMFIIVTNNVHLHIYYDIFIKRRRLLVIVNNIWLISGQVNHDVNISHESISPSQEKVSI